MIYLCNTLGRIDGNATIVSEVERQKRISILSERNYFIYHTIKESMHLLNDLVSQGIRACICHHNMRFAGVSVTNRKNLRWRLLKCRKHETIWQKW